MGLTLNRTLATEEQTQSNRCFVVVSHVARLKTNIFVDKQTEVNNKTIFDVNKSKNEQSLDRTAVRSDTIQRRVCVSRRSANRVLAPAGGALCPNSSALQEVRNCNEHACTVYHWQTGPWGPCTEDPSSPSFNASAAVRSSSSSSQGPCSLGMQTRKVICVRVNVGQVPPKK